MSARGRRDHDRELPIVSELGAEFEQLLRAEFASPPAAQATPASAAHGPAAPAPGAPAPAVPARARRPRRARPAAGRVARRSLVAVALVSLVGSAALAGRAVVGGDEQPAPATLGEVTLAGERWELSGDRLDGRLCATIASSGSVERACFRALPPGAARAGSALGGQRRIVYGLAAGGVARVRVTVGRRLVEAPTRAAADPAAAASAGLPRGVRWFAIDAGAARAAGATAPAPARVVPLDRAGRASGRPWLDCTLGAGDAACLRAAERADDAGAP